MKHPNQAALALHAGGDAGPLARWKMERHLSRCGQCREEVEAYAAVREALPAMAPVPDVQWGRLAAEMRANINLGLAAGECVRAEEPQAPRNPLFARGRMAVAFASIVALVATGLLLEHAPGPAGAPRFEGVELQSTENGIQVREQGGALRLLSGGAKDVTYTHGAQGTIGASYVDPDTGYVTVTKVYAN
jgi:hypothetical protein